MTEKDKKIQELIDLIEKKQQELSDVERPSYKTNCVYKSPDGKEHNFHVCKEEVFVDILAQLSIQNDYATKAAEELGYENFEFKHQGFSFDDWKHDIKIKFNSKFIVKKKTELLVLKERLSAIISPEMKAQMELDEISKLLGK